MSGRTDGGTLLEVGILVLAAGGALTDLVWGRIFNWMTLPALGLGCAASLWFGGWAGLGSSLLGVALALVLYGLIFWLQGMAGGDVKFLMALGAWGGWSFTLQVAGLAILVGALMGIAQLVARGRLRSFGERLYRFMLTLLVRELKAEPLQIDRGLTLPFGVAIALAAVWVALGSPLVWLGSRL